MKTRLKIYKMATSILLKLLTLKWNISRTIWRIEVSDDTYFFGIFNAFSFELKFFFDQSFPLKRRVILNSEGIDRIEFCKNDSLYTPKAMNFYLKRLSKLHSELTTWVDDIPSRRPQASFMMQLYQTGGKRLKAGICYL